ncbi:branched-chain amino acid transaminase [Senegalia sp. (in: firmicutes)]|uniref:branched-chain amino acid transaminase n=1 Tax=Senegalia sp. (in: firmicutes) TaxID=1924098 RepID=UPI003F953408
MKTSIKNRFIWLNGKVVPLQEATINVLSPTSQFGANVFEGIRCYWNEEEEQLYAFRLDDHFNRLKRSQRLLELDDTYTIEEMKKAFVDVIKANEYKEDIAVRQTLFVDGFGTWHSSGPVGMFVAPIPKAKTNPEYNKKGLNCCVSSWQRINDNSMSPRIKCGANYINSRMAQREAVKNGYDTTIILNKDGKVSEGPGSCLFIVRDGKLVTPQITDSVLESITRDTIIQIARDVLKLEVEERSVDRTELYMCDEAFLCGSAMEITPVFSVDRYQVGNGECGEITSELHVEYLKTVTGKQPKLDNWSTGIY